jgi:L-ascorbate metabolism protein UlaG (beta-lactamase superfamily)
MFIRGLEEIIPRKGEIAYVWFNDYSGVVIRTGRNIIIVDPVGIDPRLFRKVDLLLVTHEHYDHLDGGVVKGIYDNTRCTIIADKTSMSILSRFIPVESMREAVVGTAMIVGDLMVNVERSNHPPAQTPVTYVITTEDRVKIYHTSDSLPFEDMRSIGEKFSPDLAFCTVGIAPGASPSTGAEIAKLVRPKLAVPYHGRGITDFIEILSRDAPDLKCKSIEKGEVYLYPG